MDDPSTKNSQLEQQLIGSSRAMRDLRDLIVKIGRSDAPVLVTGETGSGLETVARLLHSYGARSTAPFVPVNLAAIPFDLIKAELVGYTQGAFTGANERIGLFEEANGGTIYLDEIEALSLEGQILLLSILESSSVRRLGANVERKIDVRFISSARSQMEDLAREGKIRIDLLHRIAATSIRVPPLRERREDIPELVEYFLRRYRTRYRTQQQEEIIFGSDAIAALEEYEYPGNVRELANIIERAVVLYDGQIINREALSLPKKQDVQNQPDIIALQSELDSARRELDSVRRNSISATPIWEGRAFPMERDYCFVLMPFSDTADVQKVYRDHVKPVLENRCGLRCERADDIYDISGVMQSVWEGINRARLVIADLTERNANVFYELGIAHTLGKPVIMLTQSMDFVPFDLRHLRCIVYEYKPGNIERLEQALERTIRRVLSSTPSIPSQKLI